MAKCKVCEKKGFAIETDINGLCSDCADYFYTSMQDDLKTLEQSIAALNRINHPAAAIGRLEAADQALRRIRPYVQAGLVKLPMDLPELDDWLKTMASQWQEE